MNRIEWNQSTDSIREYELGRAKAAELAATPVAPLLDTLVKKVDIPTSHREDYIPNAEAVINKVVEVGENNHTAERILERRHEVKDAPGVKIQKLQYATRVGEVLGSTQQSLTESSATHRNFSSHHKTGGIHQVLHGNSLYAYAVRYGFMSAVLALLLAVLTVTLFT